MHAALDRLFNGAQNSFVLAQTLSFCKICELRVEFWSGSKCHSHTQMVSK